ncbi:glycosyltransferase 87 family protein [Maribacter sp. 4G9]|uniref:glycosyltransferase 87 family protein n=1 Tax=Maribacter sp. 4G9 TaxID=1889777 RepID=UPI000C14638D|nr:glycosyltransferase 87 family protein [Maribacter sp. 4G9]PIB26884.1 mannosyltransferase [Maribacter sp. 4G9]
MPRRLTTYIQLHRLPLVFVLFSLVFYYTLAYQLERTDYIKLFTLFAALFFFSWKLIQFEKWNFRFLLVSGVLFRLVFIALEPHLSQDFYRFIWDGELIINQINPYLSVPNTLIENLELPISNARELYQGMGSLSAKHYSSYPPLHQLFFALAALLGGKSIMGSIIVMRVFTILADLGIFYFGRKLLKKLNRSPHLICWYFLNPLVILELTGNLHFEGIMLFFLVWSLYLLSQNKWQLAGVVLACSISVKLVPLLFMPLFLNHLGLKKSLFFYGIIGATSILLFVPFYHPDFISNYSQTVGLWFSNFEFNAGFYNVVKRIAIAMDEKPWEFIKEYGKIVPYITLITALLLTFLRNNKDLLILMASMMWLLTLYYMISTTVHPWYIISVLVLGVFNSFKFPVIWTGVIVLSYFAYSQMDNKENLLLLALEYTVVIGFIGYEVFAQLNKK